jgi:hypothetical protein
MKAVKPMTRTEKRLLAEKGPHAFFKVMRLHQGWETGVGRCACGEEFPLRFSLTVEKHEGEPVLEPGQRCPNAPEAAEGERNGR